MSKLNRYGCWLCLSLFMISSCGNPDQQNTEEEAATETESSETATNEEIPSPRREAKGLIEGVSIVVDYGSPAVKGREIWGVLEPYDKVWRAGANATTSVSFDKDVNINGEPLPAGKYAFFLIPGEGDWTVVFNKDWDEWGAFNYDETQDVLRLQVTPQSTDKVQERLTYAVSGNSLDFAWEKIRISLRVSTAQP